MNRLYLGYLCIKSWLGWNTRDLVKDAPLVGKHQESNSSMVKTLKEHSWLTLINRNATEKGQTHWLYGDIHTPYKEDTIGNRHTLLATWLHSKPFSFPSNQYCNEKHPLALRNNCEVAGDMLKERHMDPVSISTHGVSFCLLLCLLLTSSFRCSLSLFHTHIHTFVSAMGYKLFSNSGHLEGQIDRRNKRCNFWNTPLWKGFCLQYPCCPCIHTPVCTGVWID